MKKKELICIICPTGCRLEVEYQEIPEIEVRQVSNNRCKKGEAWAANEVVNPTRNISSSILVEKGNFKLVSVKTDCPIPLSSINKVMRVIKEKRIEPPIRINEILIKNPAGISTNIIATRNVEPLFKEGNSDGS